MASYCVHCGKMLSDDARFCPACGRPQANPADQAATRQPELMRPLAGRKIAGVCQGLAKRMRWDVTLLRVLFVILSILTFPLGIVLYLVLWMIMPQETPPPLPPVQPPGDLPAQPPHQPS